MQIKFAARGSDGWNDASSLVRDKFKRTFDAEVMPNPDYFVIYLIKNNFTDQCDQVASCAGVTYAGEQSKLFAEQYLDAPAEEIISHREGRPVQRDEILESGSIVSLFPKSGLALVKALPLVTFCLGKRYVLSTATKKLQEVFNMAGLEFNVLQAADPGRLALGTQGNWGSYYDNMPETGYFNMDKLGPALASMVGKYRLANIDIQILEHDYHQEKAA